MNRQNFVNKLVFLLLCCSTTIGVDIIFSLVWNRQIIGLHFYSALGLGIIFWMIYLISGKLGKWSLKKKPNS